MVHSFCKQLHLRFEDQFIYFWHAIEVGIQAFEDFILGDVFPINVGKGKGVPIDRFGHSFKENFELGIGV